MFNFFKKTKAVEIHAPVEGKIIKLEEVPDPVFGQKLIGEGAAVLPSEKGHIYAPVDGKIIQVAPTKHAIGILAEDGTEILIHVGLETVSLNGEGFKPAVTVGEKVSVGQLLLEVDWNYIKAHASSTVTPIVITNAQDGKKQIHVTEEKEGIAGKTVMITVNKK
ncbi:PTS sugar transporter subunit IIA [Neobacillus thermocopriae]|uniref:PTS sugar transporter subunit IIA n=1 Tax=Neobacillus thermocopriae TaxID=1215031 RepID=UPI002E1A5DAB|nr:PTS glucose transporter subunit IIA [Neobacillus thermocopriae]MED3714277.1 PTS glucose transporter subunit IIA [Neobacillus thermocopriae]